MAPVEVNLNVTVDTSGNIQVFGQTPYVATNVVDCSGKIPARALYDAAGASLMEFWEPLNALNTRLSTRKAAWDGSGQFVSGMSYVLNSQMTLLPPYAAPFDETKYNGVAEYRTHSTFGRLALFAYAHYLFGHGAATAAITNDQAFMDFMNGNGLLDARIPSNLAKKLFDLSDADCLAIVEQVIGQDAARAKNEDNNELAPGERQDLQFYAGDIVYVHINLKAPGVTVLNNAQQSAPTGAEFASDKTYTLKITLS
jgi:hypothetical protein